MKQSAQNPAQIFRTLPNDNLHQIVHLPLTAKQEPACGNQRQRHGPNRQAKSKQPAEQQAQSQTKDGEADRLTATKHSASRSCHQYKRRDSGRCKKKPPDRAAFCRYFFVVLPKPPSRLPSASSSSVMPNGRKMPCAKPSPAPTASVLPCRLQLVILMKICPSFLAKK